LFAVNTGWWARKTRGNAFKTLDRIRVNSDGSCTVNNRFTVVL